MIVWLATASQARDVISVPFIPLRTLMERDDDGGYAGFAIDLARLIGTEIDVEIAVRDVQSVGASVAAFQSGEVQMVAGIAPFPALRETTVFSDPVARDVVQMAALADRAAGIEADPRGLRIGILPPLVGESEARAMAENTAIEFSSPEAAILALFLRDVDAIMVPNSIAYSVTRRMGTDARIAFVGEPIRQVERVVALHRDRADLLAPTNAAIARLEADGRLGALRNRYLIELPPPAPPVLTVGVADIPPLIRLGTDGNPGGFSIDLLQALADRVGVPLRFVTVDRAAYVNGPVAAGVDLLPALVETPERVALMDFTVETQLETIKVYVRDGSALTDPAPEDLEGLTLAVNSPGIAQTLAALGLSAEVSVLPDTPSVFDALLQGQVDAVLGVESIYSAYLEQNGIGSVRAASTAPLYTLRTGIPMRPGLGALRDRFDAVIPGFLISPEYAALRARYYAKPVFWTPVRLRMLLGLGVAVLLALLAAILRQKIVEHRRQLAFEQQQADLKREQAHNLELATLVGKLERTNRALDEFAYIASHDLKEPLRGIGINAQFLMREGLPGQTGQRVARMGELAGRMQGLVSELLAYSQIGAGGPKRERVDVGSVISGIRSTLSEWLTERSAEVIQVSDIPDVLSDRTTVNLILQNLVINGVKYNSSAERRVEIGYVAQAMVNGQTMEHAIFVRDNGVGIGPEYRDKIFRIFSRLGNAPEHDIGPGDDFARGTGAGLAFVRKATEIDGGSVDFTSEPGRGSTFYVTLPMAQDMQQ